MMELAAKLESLGLAQYATILYENGFEDWNTVLDITEEDLDSLGFKRGHRRVLQKEIAGARGPNLPPPTDSNRLFSSPPSVNGTIATLESFEKRTKRRYRWHPRPDPNAPKKPKTAYVNFADHLRSDPTIASLSFVDIAREVGRRWQSLDPSVKQEWENKAAQATQVYEEHMDAYRATKQYQQYQEYLETFKKAPGRSARQKIKSGSKLPITDHRGAESSGPDRSPSASIDSPTTEGNLREECRLTLDMAMADLSTFRHDHVQDEPFSIVKPPSEAICRHAITALLDGCPIIFHLINLPEIESLLHRVYRLPGPVDALSLIELCVVAAVGSHFALVSIPRGLQRSLFATVCVLLEGLTISETIYLRLMRILLCLAMYSIREKYLSARSYISAGLAIAKLKYPFMGQDGSREDWIKIYRTLIFTECWLSQTLGFTPQNLDIHVRNAVEPICSGCSTEDAIQWQAVRIAIIGNEISSVIRQQDRVSSEAVQHLAGQLSLWQRELPSEMQLATFLSSHRTSAGPHNERAMLIVHIFYLGAVVLLYGQPIVAAEELGREVDTPELLYYRSTCLAAGEQISRLMNAVNREESWTPRSWLLIYWAFSACNVLLLGAAQALRNRSTNDHDRLISHCRSCLSTLQACAQDEPVTRRYLDMIAPVYDDLKRLRESPHIDLKRRKSEHRISINDILASDDAASSPNALERWNRIDDELPSIIHQITGLLRDPFGRAQQNDASGDPYPTPPSNADRLFWFHV